MTGPHPPGEAEFRSILPEDIEWKPFPAFPPMMRLAVLVGRGDQAWPLRGKGQGAVWREIDDAQAPGGPDLYRDVGRVLHRSRRTVRRRQSEGLSAGVRLVLPGDTWHFHWAKSGEYVTQVTAIGPLGLEYRDPADDPRA